LPLIYLLTAKLSKYSKLLSNLCCSFLSIRLTLLPIAVSLNLQGPLNSFLPRPMEY